MDGSQVFLSKISPFHVEIEFAFKENLEFHPKALHPFEINRNPYQEEIGIVAQIPPLVNIRGEEVANFFPDFFGGWQEEKSNSPSGRPRHCRFGRNSFSSEASRGGNRIRVDCKQLRALLFGWKRCLEVTPEK